MINININFFRPWQVSVPPLIRYMETKHIEEFYETGKLMLTTFERCKTIEDKSRQDKSEGICNFEVNHNNGQINGIQVVGKQSYMLCTSLIESGRLMDKFKTDNYLIIFQPLEFANCISKWIPGFKRGQVGLCTYKESKTIKRNVQFDPNQTVKLMLQASQEGNDEEAKRLFYQSRREISESINNNILNEPYLVKSSIYSDEAEVRIVWTAEDDVKEPLFLNCKEATNFCIPGSKLSKEYEPYKLKNDSTGSMIMTQNPFNI
jgi:hypothetical protein